MDDGIQHAVIPCVTPKYVGVRDLVGLPILLLILLDIYLFCHSLLYNTSEKTISNIKLIRHVGIEVPKSIETKKNLCNKAGGDGMQHMKHH